jgi:Undecaprenyl-phosphate galactose phosphotransferase WbaP
MSHLMSAVEDENKNLAFRSTTSRRNYRHLTTVIALMLSDVLAFTAATQLFRIGRSVPEAVFFAGAENGQKPIDIFFVLAAVFLLVRYVSGDYSRRRLFWDRARASTLTLICCSTPCFMVLLALPGQYSVFAEAGSWGFLLFAIPMFRQGMRIALNWLGMWKVPTALISSCARFSDVHATIDDALTLGCDIKWLALEDEYTGPKEKLRKLKVCRLDDSRDLATQLQEEGCDQAVIATDDMQSRSFADLIQRLMEVGIAVSFIPSFRRLPLIGVTPSYFFGKDMLLFQVRSSLQSLPSRFTKRTFDIAGSLAALILLLPVFILVAIAIKRHDGGPVTYSQKRTGRNGEPFFCLKFRTMAVDADEQLRRWARENPELFKEFQATFKLANDPRITKPGTWLRRTSLDELPQLLNVLRGEMSLVGPRPVLERELIEFYGPAAQLYKRVRPGVTGLWQVRGRSDTSYDERVIFDEWYILNWSFWYDIVILLQTVLVVLLRRGAY